MTPDLKDLGDLNRLIHEPARMVIMSILYSVEETDFMYLLNETGLTRGNLSSHLTKLEEAGYIQVTKTFRGKIPLTLCQITQSGKTDFELYRNQLKAIVEKLA